MVTKHHSIQREQLEMITLDQLVPANHLVRKIEASIDFTFIMAGCKTCIQRQEAKVLIQLL